MVCSSDAAAEALLKENRKLYMKWRPLIHAAFPFVAYYLTRNLDLALIMYGLWALVDTYMVIHYPYYPCSLRYIRIENNNTGDNTKSDNTTSTNTTNG